MDPVYPGAVDEIVNLGDHWNQKYLKEHKEEIKSLTKEISLSFGKAYNKLAEAQKIRKETFEELKKDTDEKELATLADGLVKEIFCGSLPQVRHFFATAVTPMGWMGYAQELSAKCPVRYLLKGGKADAASVILAEVAESALERGHNVDIFHHTMEPTAVEMVILPALGVALADAECVDITELAHDRIINIAMKAEVAEAEAAEAGTDTLPVKEAWRELVAEAALSIAEAKETHNKLESYYIQAMDFEAVDKIAKEIFGKIWAMAALKEKKA